MSILTWAKRNFKNDDQLFGTLCCWKLSHALKALEVKNGVENVGRGAGRF
jgi:hypothetical protein